MKVGPVPVPSPCIGVCAMDVRSPWCSGCLRTIEEIAAWSTLDEAAKAAWWTRLPARRVEWRRRHPAGGPPGAPDETEAG